jgi:diguanylate cyclase (GGDEF)-like protein
MIDPAEKDEADRLKALSRLQIMDTAPEPEFDELVEVAAAICEVPISLISLLDERRQWFKAAVGVSIQETSSEVAFCRYAIQQTGIMTVEDATLDPRFAQNPLVTGEMGIRFYAGVPISSSDGQPLGTLCVIDTVPRKLTRMQMTALGVLGRQATARLELREQRRAMKAALDEAEAARASLAASERRLQTSQIELESANARLRELARTDPLTGLANRRVFEERFAVAFVIARRNYRPLSVMFLDIDNFKRYNDAFGHTAGDSILIRVAQILSQTVRASDLAVRYGGEEFVLLMPETEEEQGMVLAERILQAIRADDLGYGSITLSAGVAALQDEMLKPKDLLRLADAALYEAKHTGKDRVVGHSRLSQTEVPGLDATLSRQ